MRARVCVRALLPPLVSCGRMNMCRAAICVTQLDSSTLERGIVCTPGTGACISVTLPSSLSPHAAACRRRCVVLRAACTVEAAVALVRKIKYFKGPCASRAKFHVSIGHATVMATATFFGASELASVFPVPSTVLGELQWPSCHYGAVVAVLEHVCVDG
jgi:hypothetical protein